MRRGEVWLVDMEPALGDEIKKIRPAIVVSDDAIGVLLLKVVVPLTDWKDRYAAVAWMVRLAPDAGNGLSKVSAADAFQVRSLSQQRFIRQLGKLSDRDLQKVADALAVVLSI